MGGGGGAGGEDKVAARVVSLCFKSDARMRIFEFEALRLETDDEKIR